MMAQSPDRENVVWNQKLLIFGATLTAPTQLMETTSCLSHTLCAKILNKWLCDIPESTAASLRLQTWAIWCKTFNALVVTTFVIKWKNVASFKTKNAFFDLFIFWNNNVNMFQRFNNITVISIRTYKAYENELVILRLCTMSSAVHDLTLSLLRLVLLPGYYFQ